MTTGERVVAGRYRLLSRLGAGGMGTVWRAEDAVLGREVAVKEVTFPAGLTEKDRQVLSERTRREARAAARLDHPSAVTVYDVVEQDDAPYLVMELVEARTLAEVVREEGPLPPQRVAEIGLALLGALEAAHAQGIVHRDVKPSNVLVREDGRVVLTDFGIATATGDSTITTTGLLLGSPAYIAPERARGETSGPASDLWSLGATLYTAVEGRPPYDGDEPLLTVTAVVTGEHAPFVAAGPLAPVIDGLLAKDPAQRPSGDDLRRRLEAVTRTRSAPQPTALLTAPLPAREPRTAAIPVSDVREDVAAAQAPVAPPRRPLPPVARPAAARRPGWLVPAVLAGALALLAGGVALALSGGDDPSRPTTAAPAAEPSAPAEDDEAPAEEPAEQEDEAPAEEPEGEGLPEGWTTDSGGAGWTVALPPGYAQTRAGEYVGPNRRTLRVETGEGQPDAVADRERQAEDFARRHPSYEEISIEAVDYRGYEAADWEFTYEGLHVLNRVFVVDGVGHSLFFQTRQADFDEARSEFERIVDAFRPVGA